jgi:hypothetical protein
MLFLVGAGGAGFPAGARPDAQRIWQPRFIAGRAAR